MCTYLLATSFVFLHEVGILDVLGGRVELIISACSPAFRVADAEVGLVLVYIVCYSAKLSVGTQEETWRGMYKCFACFWFEGTC